MHHPMRTIYKYEERQKKAKPHERAAADERSADDEARRTLAKHVTYVRAEQQHNQRARQPDVEVECSAQHRGQPARSTSAFCVPALDHWWR